MPEQASVKNANKHCICNDVGFSRLLHIFANIIDLCTIIKAISLDRDQTAQEQSYQGPHCLSVR